jgi:hypothetical protein
MRIASLLAFALVTVLAQAAVAAPIVETFNPSQDNTVIQATDITKQLSNGQGDIFVGRTNQDGQGPATISIRRGLIQFDIASKIPAGAKITSVSLTMRDVMGLNGDPVVELHTALNSWGEGSSFQNGGMGATATAGDATWYYRFFNDDTKKWANPGGDYSGTISGSAVVKDDLGGGQLFTWTGPQMVLDVQAWLDSPSTNFGWFVLGDETRGQSAKRFNSGESTISPNVPPVLSVTYVIPEPSTLVLSICGLMGSCLAAIRRRCPLSRS